MCKRDVRTFELGNTYRFFEAQPFPLWGHDTNNLSGSNPDGVYYFEVGNFFMEIEGGYVFQGTPSNIPKDIALQVYFLVAAEDFNIAVEASDTTNDPFSKKIRREAVLSGEFLSESK